MTTMERARRLADQRPEGSVPCPACGAAVKGANLERHLTRAHQAGEEVEVAHHARWGGPERIGSRRLLGLTLGVAAAAAAWTVVSETRDDRVIVGSGLAASLAVLVWAAVGWGAPLFPGRLRVDGRGALLRHSFGLGRRRIRTIETVVLGGAWEGRPTGNTGGHDSYASVDVRVGTYLQLWSGRRRITVHCRTGGSVRKTWSGWEQGGRRKRLDITLDLREFVALQLALWELGVLAPR